MPFPTGTPGLTLNCSLIISCVCFISLP
jgi:hypothetical protein